MRHLTDKKIYAEGDRGYFDSYRRRYPERVTAQQAVNLALKKGKLIRKPCDVCSTTKNVQGHHEDYTKPFEVTWLCSLHHHSVHQTKRIEERRKQNAGL